MSKNKPIGTSILFVNSKKEVLLALRDDIPTIACPNCWDILGGHPEGVEMPEECIIREMQEEIKIDIKNPTLFKVSDMADRTEYTFWQKADLAIENINLHEGQKLQWFSEDEVRNMPDDEIGFNLKPIILEFFNKIITNKVRSEIGNLIQAGISFDEIEQGHKDDIINWIKSGVEIFRIEKPAVPLKHLVSYSVLVDSNKRKILLFDHKKALKKLPSGGHIDKDEMPYEAAKRELVEELGIEPRPAFDNPDIPFFVTVTETVGLTPGHIDVSLWYVFYGDSELKVNDEADEFRKEFAGFHWLGFDEILSTPIEEFDQNLHRFVNKLKKYV